MTDTRTFDLDYRMTSVKDAGTSNIQYLSYSYNAANNVTAHHRPRDRGQQPDLHLRPHRADHISLPAPTALRRITYDSNSNRLTAGGINYTYSAGTATA